MKKSNILLILILLLGLFLRFYKLEDVPYGLYIDEVSIGYNAHTILTSGKDEHGEPFPLFFEAFGEYKLPVYIYLTAGSMAIFGNNEFAVRFPSSLFGTATIAVLYYFVLVVFRKYKNKNAIAFTAAFLLAVTPWHIHFSRGGFEANIALFFYLLGCLLALVFWEKKKISVLVIACISFIVVLYTYNTYRFLVPVTSLIFFSFAYFKLPKLKKKTFMTAILMLVLSLPMIYFSFSPGGEARFAATSAFEDYEKVDKLTDKIILYPAVIIKNYFSYFSLDFLFSYGDRNGRHQLPVMGLLYRWELPFLLIGLFWLLKQKDKRSKYIILGLLLIAPIIPAIARPSPHSLRALLMVLPLTILVAIGLVSSLNYLKKLRWVLAFAVILIFSYETSLYIHHYYEHYNNVNALDWGAGYKETAKKAQNYNKQYKHIFVEENKLENAPLYFHFYTPDSPVTFVSDRWTKPLELKNEKVMYIRPFYGNRDEKQSIDQVYLPGPNKDIFVQFWIL